MILFTRTLFLLIWFDFMTQICPFGSVYEKVKRWGTRKRDPGPDTVSQVCRAVNYACVFYPRLVQCQLRALVTTRLLRLHGAPAELVLGAQKLPFRAHAWVELAGEIINERCDRNGYPIKRPDVQTVYSVWARY